MRSALVIVFCLMVLRTSGQTSSVREEDDEELTGLRVMVIPYNADFEEDYALKNKDLQKTVGTRWKRFGLKENSMPRIIFSESGKKIIFNDTVSESTTLIKELYHSIDYAYEKKNKKEIREQQKNLQAFFSRYAGALPEREVEYTSDASHQSFLNIRVKDPQPFRRLAQMYDLDLFVCLNFVEILTDYRNLGNDKVLCIREIKIHFTILSPEAKQLYGDIVSFKFSDAPDHVDKFIMNSFPLIANYTTPY